MSKPKILVIEDEPQMRRNIMTILEMENFEPHGASSGREGLEVARAVRPDLILCDLMMGDVDGYAVLEQVRADIALARTAFVFLTAKGEKTDFRAGMNLGADDYLTKPVVVDELLATIKARLSNSARRQPRS